MDYQKGLEIINRIYPEDNKKLHRIIWVVLLSALAFSFVFLFWSFLITRGENTLDYSIKHPEAETGLLVLDFAFLVLFFFSIFFILFFAVYYNKHNSYMRAKERSIEYLRANKDANEDDVVKKATEFHEFVRERL